MGRGRRGRIALADAPARSRLPESARVPTVDIELWLAWSYRAGEDGRSALPPEQALGIVTVQRMNNEEMICFDVAGEGYMAYPATTLFHLRPRLREGLRGVVVKIDRDKSRFTVRLALPAE